MKKYLKNIVILLMLLIMVSFLTWHSKEKAQQVKLDSYNELEY